MGRKQELTDRFLRSLKAAPDGERYEVMDTTVPGLAIRVTDTGHKSFVYIRRFPGSKNPARRALGQYVPVNEATERRRYMERSKEDREKETFEEYMVRTYGTATLAGARTKARQWAAKIESGIDPKEGEQQRKIEQARKRQNSTAAVAEVFFERHLRKTRKGAEVERDMRREFVEPWGTRPITAITRHDVMAVIDAAVDRGAPYQAHNLLGYARRFFNWAIARGIYGIEQSPCDRLKPKEVIGKKAMRSRVLTDAELRAFWKVTEGMAYPYGPLFQVLLLTGQRKSEVAEAQWTELDLSKKLWTIPKERMKADAAHVVPLADDVIAILRSLPRFKKGNHVFSTDFGVKPVNGFSKAKAKLDTAMLAKLSEQDSNTKLPHFVIHDIRRSVRTQLSALPVPDLVRELVIGHTKPGLHKVYDQHAYETEKRHALDLWAARLRSIVMPPPSNVVELESVRA
jgi:integrase